MLGQLLASHGFLSAGHSIGQHRLAITIGWQIVLNLVSTECTATMQHLMKKQESVSGVAAARGPLGQTNQTHHWMDRKTKESHQQPRMITNM